MFVQKVWLYLSTGYLFLFVVCVSFVLRALRVFSPALTKKIILKMNERTTMVKNPNFTYDDWGPTFLTDKFIKTASRHMWLSLGQKAFVGEPAPDSPVVTMDKRQSSICNFLKGAYNFAQ